MATSLKTAKSDIVLLMMDDFYLKAPVDDGMFNKILQYMSENEDVASITFLNEPGITSKGVPEIEGFYYRKKSMPIQNDGSHYFIQKRFFT